jgi:hypothetical protein
MTKKETMDSIIYDLKMKGHADCEIDNAESCTLDKLAGGGYCLESQFRYMEFKNLTEVRKEVSKLGQKILWL